VPPESKLMDLALRKIGFRDARAVAYAEAKNRSTNTQELRNTYACCHASQASVSASSLAPRSVPGGGADGVEGTCRFYTRIDWILLPPVPLLDAHMQGLNCTCFNDPNPNSGGVSGYQVTNTMDVTDHNMVTATLRFSVPSGMHCSKHLVT
jgi:hypothetical protein